MNKKEDILVREINEILDFDRASSAFVELKKINPGMAAGLATDVLLKKKGDAYFQAAAFDLLYSIDNIFGIEFIIDNASDVDVMVLSAMLECVSEDAGILSHDERMVLAVNTLRGLIMKLSVDDSERIKKSIEWFLSSFDAGAASAVRESRS